MLFLTCCKAGRMVHVAWLEQKQGRGGGEPFELVRAGADDPYHPSEQPFDKRKTPVDWVVSESPCLFGEHKVIRVRFCPACGKETPKLRIKKKVTYHKPNFDHGGNCRTCKVRYCDGQDPSRVYEVDS